MRILIIGPVGRAGWRICQVPGAAAGDPTMTKTLSFAAVHFTVAFAVGYALTGSIVVGGLLALVERAGNTVAYHFHEKAWARWGRQ
jgi:uncharacterized membrane protein